MQDDRKTLYDSFIESDEKLNKLLEESGGEITDEINNEIKIKEYIINRLITIYSEAIQSDKYILDGLTSKKAKLDEKIKSIKEKIEDKRKFLANFMNQIELESFEGDIYTIVLRESEKINIVSEENVPDNFKNIESIIKINKNEIKKYIKSLDGKIPNWVKIEKTKYISIK